MKPVTNLVPCQVRFHHCSHCHRQHRRRPAAPRKGFCQIPGQVQGHRVSTFQGGSRRGCGYSGQQGRSWFELSGNVIVCLLTLPWWIASVFLDLEEGIFLEYYIT